MAFVPVLNTALMEFRMLFAGQKIENTIWVQSEDGAYDGSTLTDLANVGLDWWTDSFAQLVSNQVSLREVVVTDMTTDTSAQVSVAGAGAVGLEGTGAQASSVAFTVSFRTASRGRSFRGRNYIPAVPSSFIESINLVAEEYVEAVILQYTALLTALSTAGYRWVIASRFSGVDGDGKPIPRVAGVITPVTNVVVADNVLDSQRRRLPGRGQ